MILDLINPAAENLDAVFFDFDGVLVDSVPVKTAAYKELFNFLGDEAVSLISDYHRRNGGVDRYRKIRYVFDSLGISVNETEVQRLADEFSDLVKEKVINAPGIQGMQQLLNHLTEKKVPLFIVSGTPETELLEIVRARKIDHLFRECCGSPGTKPEILRRLMMSYSLDPENCLFFGDAVTDFNASTEAGVLFIGIPEYRERT